MSALRSRSIFLMGQSSHWGRRASASSRQVAAAPPASHTASMVMGRSSPMVCCASSVLRPAHTVWRVVRSVAIEKIMLGRVGGLGGGRRSVAVADVPHGRRGGNVLTRQDRLAAVLFCLQAGGVCLHRFLHDGAGVGGSVGDEHGLGSFDVFSLQGQGIWQAPGRTLL